MVDGPVEVLAKCRVVPIGDEEVERRTGINIVIAAVHRSEDSVVVTGWSFVKLPRSAGFEQRPGDRQGHRIKIVAEVQAGCHLTSTGSFASGMVA